MWDVKAPTHCSQRVGDVVPGVVVYLKFTFPKGAYLLTSFIKITCKLQSHWQKSFNHFYGIPETSEVRSHLVMVSVIFFFNGNNVIQLWNATTVRYNEPLCN